ncbi:MAG: MBL fold metallo-hydrolase, partial [Clostridia bacterium]|nr:MBL fold metallo-hydrolase [Clostridia bacterium]
TEKGNTYFVDMGTSAIDALRKRNIEIDTVKGIFISHMHGDHTNGLIQFIDLITWYFKTPDPVVCLPDLEAARVIDDWLTVTMNGNKKEINYKKTENGCVFDDGILKVTAIATEHCPNSYAYLIECADKRVLITGDLRNPNIDFPDAGDKMIDLVICESAHFAATEYEQVFPKYNIEKVCVTHYSDRFLGSVLELVKRLNEKGIEALRASDDLEIEV